MKAIQEKDLDLFLLNCHLPHRPSLCKEDVHHFVLQSILALGPALFSAIVGCHGWEHTPGSLISWLPVGFDQPEPLEGD